MNCKPGDLAIIIRPAGSDPANVGRLVEVLRETDGLPWEGPCWWVRALGGRVAHTILSVVEEGRIEDSRLRPIRPGDESETVEREAALCE